MDDRLFDDFPLLETNRLFLRQVGVMDLAMIYAFNADSRTLHHVPRDLYTSHDQAVAKLAEFEKGHEQRRGIWWTFVRREDNCAIGYGGLFDIDATARKAEIGYGFLPPYWGQGFAGECAAAMTRCGRDYLGLHRIYGLVSSGNTASARVLQRLGYVHEGRLRADRYARGRYFDMDVWGLLGS